MRRKGVGLDPTIDNFNANARSTAVIFDSGIPDSHLSGPRVESAIRKAPTCECRGTPRPGGNSFALFRLEAATGGGKSRTNTDNPSAAEPQSLPLLVPHSKRRVRGPGLQFVGPVPAPGVLRAGRGFQCNAQFFVDAAKVRVILPTARSNGSRRVKEADSASRFLEESASLPRRLRRDAVSGSCHL